MKLPQLELCLSGNTRRTVPSGDSILRAAVAIIFRPGAHSNLEMLMIHRAEHPKDPWSGHMAFPGGRIDPIDPSATDGAIREVREELGLSLESARLLGELEPLTVPPRVLKTQMWVHAFVFYADQLSNPQPNEEVQAVHWFDFARFESREGRGEFQYHGHGYDMVLPEVNLDGCRIWGMSLRLIDDLVDRVQCPWRDGSPINEKP
ncbi:MAG: CoA pyrophosphatase [Myxococcota bacterium]|nr:CoA pyrophosphatase [Myxococcota bacterium]